MVLNSAQKMEAYMNFLKMILWPTGRVSRKMAIKLLFEALIFWTLLVGLLYFLINMLIENILNSEAVALYHHASSEVWNFLWSWPMLVIITKRAHDRNISVKPFVIAFLIGILLMMTDMYVLPKTCVLGDEGVCSLFRKIFTGLTGVGLVAALIIGMYIIYNSIISGSAKGAERFGPPPIIPDPTPFTKNSS